MGAPVVSVDGKADGVELAAYHPLPEDADLDAPFTSLFAPDDPVTTLELEMIQRVRELRAADGGDYAEGDNPFTIHYAVYNLRNPAIVGALADAADVGVDVQILIDDKQLDPERTWNTADEELVARGFELAMDHRELDDTTRVTADLIGIHHNGLMHFKTRIFRAPGFEAVLSGSLNPGDNAVMNEENLQLIREPRLIARYEAAYAEIIRGRAIDNQWDDAAAVNVLFTPSASGPRAGEKLLQWISEEDESILLMVFSLRDVTAPGSDRSLVDLLADKVAAGVPVYVITDRKQSDGVDADGNPIYRNDRTEDRLRAAGVHVYEATNRASPYTAMHHKVGVFGLTHIRVVADAANWTFAGLGSRTRTAKNFESQLFIDTDALDGGATGRRFLAQWLRVLERYADQSADDGEPPAAEVEATLMALPAWPRQPTVFVANAETSWGEGVVVRGDLPELGRWGMDSDGVALSTDAASYPTWQNDEPVGLPLGTRFQWKLVITSGSGARWEAGQNRFDRAMPAAFATGPRVYGASFR
ncbi:MAG: hypothetical protein GXP55_22495 [Deltaproteobacteria bacterium]|nr:hypothetical protein [Deltaproteobacteria bacterium]